MIEDLRTRFRKVFSSDSSIRSLTYDAATFVNVVNTMVSITSARTTLLPQLGGDNLPRIPADTVAWSNHSKDGLNPAADQYHLLGVTPDLADEVLIDVYNEQILIDSHSGHIYLGALHDIARIRNSDTLNMHVVMERSRGRFTLDDINEAYEKLGCDPKLQIRSEDYVMERFSTAMETAVDAERRMETKQSLKLIADHLESDMLRMIHMTSAEEARPLMDIDKAYKMLEVGPETDEDTLLAVYGIRVSPSLVVLARHCTHASMVID